MCKFDKNQVYSPRQVAEALAEIFPDKKFESIHGTVSSYFTKSGYLPTNGQTQRRVFSGVDCQNVYDHFVTSWENSSQLSFKFEGEKFSRVSVELRCIEGEELEKRSRALNIAKASIVTTALRDYFEKEDLIRTIRKLQEEN